jgi:hypothetical protein
MGRAKPAIVNLALPTPSTADVGGSAFLRHSELSHMLRGLLREAFSAGLGEARCMIRLARPRRVAWEGCPVQNLSDILDKVVDIRDKLLIGVLVVAVLLGLLAFLWNLVSPYLPF